MRTKTAGKSHVQFLVRSASGFIVSLIACIVFALVLVKKDIPTYILPYFLIGSGGIGSFSGAFLAARKTKLKGYISGLLSAGIVVFLIILICLIINKFNVGIHMLWIVTAGVICGMIGGIVSKNV